MRTKVKPEKLKLGDVLYFVDEHHLTEGVQQATVTTLSLNDKKEVTFNTDNGLSSYHLNSWDRYVTRSVSKAEIVWVRLLEKHEHRELKWQTEREIHHENLKNLVEVGKK